MGAQIYGRTAVADGDKWIAVKVNADGSLAVGGSSGSVTLAQEIADAGPSGPATEFTGSIATGGTAVTVAAEAAAVERWLQNTSSGDLRIRLSAAGTASSTAGRVLNPGGMYLFTDPQAALSVWGATTGQTWEGETR